VARDYLRDVECLLGWAAVYWTGAGDPTVYASIATGYESSPAGRWLYEPDPEDLPSQALQHYFAFYRSERHLYSIHHNGYDEYHLIGRDEPVEGYYLSDADWVSVCGFCDHEVWGRRGLWGRDYDDWQNEVPV
jgi:hypothetical protein